MTERMIFLWGALADAQIRALVLGPDLPARNATLRDHSLRSETGGLPDFLVPDSGAQVDGTCVALAPDAQARLAHLASLWGAAPRQAQVWLGDHAHVATLYAPPVPDQTLPLWDSRDWDDLGAPTLRRALAELLALAAIHPPELLRMRYPMLLSHAAAVTRGTRDARPVTLRAAFGPGDVVSHSARQPYTGFFAVQVDDLQFRRFDGSLSPVVRRACFVMSDAVTILPYDPARDLVMVIEQFRYGPYVRGLRDPWILEPIAGRIDAGEAPRTAALREMREEARLDLPDAALVQISTCYPSPGAVSELLYNYVALCPLDPGQEGIAGLDSEAEDIRSHVLPLDQVLAMIDTTEIQNAPLIQAAYWLALNRARLRAGS